MVRERFDVVIVGARCAGSPLGAILARCGLRVAVVEQATFPQPTLSSHCIQADSLAFLDRLGVTGRLRATGARVMTHADSRLDDFRFIAEFPQHPGDAGGALCIRRHVLDPILADAAAEAGAFVRMGSRVVGVLEDRCGRVSGVRVRHGDLEWELHARLVVGADGRNSFVGQQRGARKYHIVPNERWYYWTYFEGADLSPRPTFVFHRWGDRHIFAGPADSGLYIVGVSPERHERAQFRAALEENVMRHARSVEPVAAALANARRAEKIYGIVKFSGYFREAAGPGWVLVGDAGHFKDPAAGRGIGDAFHQAEMLAPAIAAAIGESNDAIDRATARFHRWRDRRYAPYYWLANDLGKAGALPAIVPQVVRRLHRRGQINQFLDLFGHRTSPSDVLSPARLAGGAAQLLLRPPGGDRRAALAELGGVLATEARRRWVSRRPVVGDATAPATVADAGEPGNGAAGRSDRLAIAAQRQRVRS
jgi:2-polyprenyl-6-methoxyphenol hydroxylase-like FAD-dependent oxidoreductase